MKFEFDEFEALVSQAVDEALRAYLLREFSGFQSDLEAIFRYHLGLENGTQKKGKRIRPLLTALCAECAGLKWEKVIPAATAIELIHNFSLIHDDIEDGGETRRGIPAVWKKWGLAKGINAGDAMFAAAFNLMSNSANMDDTLFLKAIQLLSCTSLRLTEGQQLDIEFEKNDCLSRADYLRMVMGKTAALLGCCAQMGAMLGGLSEMEQQSYREFGENLGVAFQIYDDWLGVWGDPDITGKSVSSDLLEKKKSYPAVLGFQHSSLFAQRWSAGPLKENEVREMAGFLEADGVKQLVEEEFHAWTDRAMESLDSMRCGEEVRSVLRKFAYKLLIRQK